MKPKFGSVLKTFWNQYSRLKNGNPSISDEEIYSYGHSKYEIAFRKNPENYNIIASLRGWELWYSDLIKNFLHVFFLENKLKEILENIKIKVDNVKEFIEENGISEIMWSDKYQGNINVKVFCFGIHLPNIKHGFAFKLSLYDNMLITYCVKDDIGAFEITDEAYKFFLKKDDENCKRKIQIFQLCINTILYMDCYPECIVEGVPEDINSIEHKEKSCQLSLSKDFDEIKRTGGAKSPYLKGTYFMTFRDERYTKMRGKTIRVKAKFIKGKAVTAKTANDFSRLDGENL